MPKVIVPRNRIADGSLPDVCVVCGNVASCQRFSFLGVPAVRLIPISPLLRVLWFWGRILVSTHFGETSPGGLPFCDLHRSYWVWRAWFIIGGWMILVVSMAAAFLLTKLTEPDPPPHWSIAIAMGWFFIFLPAYLIVHLSSIRPTWSNWESITLAGASQPFAAVIEAEKDRREPVNP